jgi:hypothetical protein
MSILSKIFASIAFITLILVAFPLVNNMFTATDGIANVVGNTTLGHPYSTMENLLWQNWHYIIFAAAIIGFIIWIVKDDGGQ